MNYFIHFTWQYCIRIWLWSLSCPFLVTIWPKGIKTAQNTVYKSFPGLLFLLLNISFQHLGKLRLKDLLLLGFSWPVFVFSFTGQWLVPIRVGIVFGETFRIIGLDGMKSWWVLEQIKLQHSRFCLTYTYSLCFACFHYQAVLLCTLRLRAVPVQSVESKFGRTGESEFFTFARFARFPRSRGHPEGLLAV